MKKHVLVSDGSVGTYSESLITLASAESVIFRQLGGKWSVTGFLMTFKSFSGELTDRIESL